MILSLPARRVRWSRGVRVVLIDRVHVGDPERPSTIGSVRRARAGGERRRSILSGARWPGCLVPSMVDHRPVGSSIRGYHAYTGRTCIPASAAVRSAQHLRAIPARVGLPPLGRALAELPDGAGHVRNATHRLAAPLCLGLRSHETRGPRVPAFMGRGAGRTAGSKTRTEPRVYEDRRRKTRRIHLYSWCLDMGPFILGWRGPPVFASFEVVDYFRLIVINLHIIVGLQRVS